MFLEGKNSQYGEGIELDEYNGTWSIVRARKAQNGTVYKQWCYPQGRGQNAGPIDKSLPWKIELGSSREDAIETVKALLQALEEDVDPMLGKHDQSNANDDIPF